MLKPKQKKCAEIMVCEPSLSIEKVAEQIGVDPSTIYRWKRDSEFTDYISELCRERFKELEKEAVNQLGKAVKAGEWKAVQYVLDGHHYAPKTELDITSNDIVISIVGDNHDTAGN